MASCGRPVGLLGASWGPPGCFLGASWGPPGGGRAASHTPCVGGCCPPGGSAPENPVKHTRTHTASGQIDTVAGNTSAANAVSLQTNMQTKLCKHKLPQILPHTHLETTQGNQFQTLHRTCHTLQPPTNINQTVTPTSVAQYAGLLNDPSTLTILPPGPNMSGHFLNCQRTIRNRSEWSYYYQHRSEI